MQETIRARVSIVQFDEDSIISKDRQTKPRFERNRINKRKKKKTVFHPPVSNREKNNVYNALKHAANKDTIIRFRNLSTKNAGYIEDFLKAYVAGNDYGDFHVNLLTVQSQDRPFEELSSATKHELGSLHTYWPGLETLAPNRTLAAPGDDGSTLSGGVGLNVLNIARQVLPDDTSRSAGFRIAISCAKDYAIRQGFKSSVFKANAETFLNTGNEGYQRAMDEALANYIEPDENEDEDAEENVSVTSGKMSMQAAAETAIAYWVGLQPMHFFDTIRSYVFVEL